MKNAALALKVSVCLLIPGILFSQPQASLRDQAATTRPGIAAPSSPAVAAPAAPNVQAIVPRLIMFNGALRDLTGKPIVGPVDVTFSLYTDELGGSALWFETQTVQADSLGRYAVLLGAMSPTGVPMELFTEGRARWLGVMVQSLPEQPRVLLVSVPYAIKAGDAETLGGRPASAYQLAPESAASSSTMAKQGTTTTRGDKSLTGKTSGPTPKAVTITTSYVPVFASGTGTLTNSVMFQSGTRIGVNTNSPASSFDVNGGVFMVGTKTAAAGQGGTMRFRDDTGTQRWLFGLPGSAGSQDFFMYNYTNGRSPIYIQNGAASYSLYLNGNGNVGVGTASPAHKLDVVGAINSSSTVTGTRLISTVATGTAPLTVTSTTLVPNLNASMLGGIAPSGFATIAANAFTGNQSIAGTLGVGTTSPVPRLHVLTSGTTSSGLLATYDAIGGECSAANCAGVDAISKGTGGYGIFAEATDPTGWAGYFTGDVAVAGTAFVNGSISSTAQAGTGLIVKSPDGTKCARIGIDNTGTVVATPVTCPALRVARRQ